MIYSIGFIALVVIVGLIIKSVTKKTAPPYQPAPRHIPVPSFGATDPGPTDSATSDAAVDTARAAAGFNQPQG